MGQTMTISKARAAAEAGAVTITQQGKPVMALLSWDLYESLIETIEILDDKEMMAALRQGIKEAKAGKGISWEAAKKGLA
jgi:prevent-host-death family protein